MPKKTKKPKRNYSHRTIKALFALSYNQCAFPTCKNQVVVSATDQSDSIVLNQICHIYALSDDGPRGKQGLTEDELNAPENLILFCPTHHVIVDGQHETYPATLLHQWKSDHEAAMRRRVASDLNPVQADVFSHPYFPVELVDQRINEDLARLRRSRFFVGYDVQANAHAFARKLIRGEFSGGGNAARGDALAWCARIISRGTRIDTARECLELASTLSTSNDVAIAGAFLIAAKGDIPAALDRIAEIDAPAARSAALMIVGHHKGARAALDWLHQSGTEIEFLDGDGKFIAISHQFALGNWCDAYEATKILSEKDCDEAPALIYATGLATLLQAVPVEFREVVSRQVPMQCGNFPLADDGMSLDRRRLATQKFLEIVEIARALECPKSAADAEEYALWLALRDPESGVAARKKLQDRLRDYEGSLRLVPLGLQFGLDLDMFAVDQEIERETARHGGMTLDAAKARFALIFRQKTPSDAAEYIARHREQLAIFFDEKSMHILEIDLLVKSGQAERAKSRLELLAEGCITTEEAYRLRERIAAINGDDPIESLIKLFGESDSINDLGNLVDALQSEERWDDLCEFGEMLFERTRSALDAERYAMALSNAGRNVDIVAFLERNPSFLAQSQNMQLLIGWAYYRLGDLVKARDTLSKLSDSRDHANIRALRVNLAIGMGDWNALSVHLASESRRKNERSPQELIQAAQLAIHSSSPYAKELLFAAAERAGEDAAILAAAYLLASSAGWEDDADVHRWLEKAAALSGDDGPIQTMSLQEIADHKPDWERHESEIWRLYSRGEMPAFLAAKALNRSLVQLFLQPALANQLEPDPRRRGVVPVCSGQREVALPALDQTIGFDCTALLTLAFLALLDIVFDAVREVYLPHSTLFWLFEEKQKASFHQPSRVKSAHRLRGLLATGSLDRFSATTTPDSDLSAQVGYTLAHLIAEAEKNNETADRQSVVVRPFPVHRNGSLMQENADLSAHTGVLSNCAPIVDKLREKGQITKEEANRALKYLKLQETPWPDQPNVLDGAILYLDDLAVSHFLHLGLLDKLKNAGFKAIVSSSEIDEANQLIAYESVSGEVMSAIESIRASVQRGIDSGKIKIGEAKRAGKDQSDDEFAHPSVDVLSLAGECGWLVIDDRVLNQHKNIHHRGNTSIVASSLDLLQALKASGVILFDKFVECNTRLRRGGFIFISVDEDELEKALSEAPVTEDGLIETAELRAIRENLLQTQMSNWLQLPKETYWLDRLLKTLIKQLSIVWAGQADLVRARAVSDWLLERIDIRQWAHCLGGKAGESFVMEGRLGIIMLLLSLPTGFPPEERTQYWAWIEDRLLEPIKGEEAEFYQRILDAHQQQIADLVTEYIQSSYER